MRTRDIIGALLIGSGAAGWVFRETVKAEFFDRVLKMVGHFENLPVALAIEYGPPLAFVATGVFLLRNHIPIEWRRRLLEPIWLIVMGATLIAAGFTLALYGAAEHLSGMTTSSRSDAPGAPKRYVAYDLERRFQAIDQFRDRLEVLDKIARTGSSISSGIGIYLNDGSLSKRLRDLANENREASLALGKLLGRYAEYGDITQILALTDWQIWDLTVGAEKLALEVDRFNGKPPGEVIANLSNNQLRLNFENLTSKAMTWTSVSTQQLTKLRVNYGAAPVIQ